MTNNNKSSEEKKIVAVEQALTRTEQFIEENQKLLITIVAVIVLIVGGYLAFTKFYLAPKEKEAQSQMFVAEKYFEQDSLNLAINGDGNYLGFQDIINDYSFTKSANLAHYYLGVCYLKKGEFQKAIDNLKKFDSDDNIIQPMAYGAIGDAYSELNNPDKAVSYYIDAADESENSFTAPIFLMKAGITYEDMKKYDKALEIYERIQKEYPKSTESREIEKYIAKVKALLNKI